MIIKIFTFISLILLLAFISCDKATPAGFWKNYKMNFLVSNISKQGPYGGHRAIHWKAEEPSIFDTENLLDFAAANGWTLTDSSEFDQNQTMKWTYDNKQIFPLSYTGFDKSVKSTSTYNHFPRWFDGQLKLYKFKTGWVTIDPGTNNSIEENGFILLIQDRSEIAVYHLWGE